jgi:hypothetical protein
MHFTILILSYYLSRSLKWKAIFYQSQAAQPALRILQRLTFRRDDSLSVAGASGMQQLAEPLSTAIAHRAGPSGDVAARTSGMLDNDDGWASATAPVLRGHATRDAGSWASGANDNGSGVDNWTFGDAWHGLSAGGVRDNHPSTFGRSVGPAGHNVHILPCTASCNP